MKSLPYLRSGLEGLFLLMMGLPLILTVLLSFTENSLSLLNSAPVWTLTHYARLLTPTSLEILLMTLQMAALNSFLCVLVGYTCARFLVNLKSSQQILFLFLFLAPYFVNSLVRLLALQSFVGTQGPIQGFFRIFQEDFISLSWSHNTVMMHVGLLMQYLPFAILPLYLTLKKWDPGLPESARDLGASGWQVFSRVEWPWMKGTARHVFFLIFIPSFGEYVVPEVLQGSTKMMWGQYITEAFLKWRNWPLGAALGCVMILIVVGLSWFSQRPSEK
jgi:spermidine/putrescine transport system permease protein